MKLLNQIFLCLFFLIVSHSCSAQIKEGLYIWNFGSGSEQITFKKNNQFSFVRNDHTGYKNGFGTYNLFDSKLSLIFESDSIDYRLNIDTTETINDSVKILITLFDYQTKASLNTQINLDNEGGYTDSNGQASFQFLKSNKTIGIESIPYKYLPRLTFELSKNYKITLFLKPIFTDRFANGDVEEYQIKKISKQKIELKDSNFFYRMKIYKTKKTHPSIFK